MWKQIKGFENYLISDKGEVKSAERIIHDAAGHTYVHPEKVLKPNKTPNGYQVVYLRANGKTYAKYIHRLVAESFMPTNDDLVVNHVDGDKSNNNLNNLEWVTYHDNNQHAYDIGLRKKGEQHYLSKLTENDVREIRSITEKVSYQEIADRYHVSKATIRDVMLYRTWRTIC